MVVLEVGQIDRRTLSGASAYHVEFVRDWPMAEARWNAYRALLDGQLPLYVPFTCFARMSRSGLWIIVRSSGAGRELSDYRDKIRVVS